MTYTPLPSAQNLADRNRQKPLGRALNRLYSAVPAEPIPYDLLALLAAADGRRLTPKGQH